MSIFWVVIGGLLLIPGVGAVIYGMIMEPVLRWSVIISFSLLGGMTALTYGLTS